MSVNVPLCMHRCLVTLLECCTTRTDTPGVPTGDCAQRDNSILNQLRTCCLSAHQLGDMWNDIKFTDVAGTVPLLAVAHRIQSGYFYTISSGCLCVCVVSRVTHHMAGLCFIATATRSSCCMLVCRTCVGSARAHASALVHCMVWLHCTVRCCIAETELHCLVSAVLHCSGVCENSVE